MTISETTINNVRVLKFHGVNLDAGVCDTISEKFVSQLPACEPLLVDLEGVQFTDSAGLGILLTMSRRAGADRFGLSCVNGRMKRCLERLPIGRIPRQFNTVDDGVAQLTASPQPLQKNIDSQNLPKTK